MDPSTRPEPGEPPHPGWRNRDYDETAEAPPQRRRWLPWIAAGASVIMAFGLLWNSIKPIFE